MHAATRKPYGRDWSDVTGTMSATEAIDAFLGGVLRSRQSAWPCDWRDQSVTSATIARVKFHGIASLLADLVGESDGWPEEVLAALREEARLQAFWIESQRSAVAGLLDRFHAAGIGALVMKGTALAYSVYDQPQQRRMGDTDLLIRKRDIKHARACLTAAGFAPSEPGRRYNFQQSWSVASNFGFVHDVDLHWRMTTSPKLNLAFDVEECFARAVPLERLCAHALALDPVLNLLRCSLNQALHGVHGYFVEGARIFGGGRLAWAWDNDLVARSFNSGDWQDLLGLCRAKGFGPLVLKSLDFSRHVLNSEMPPALIERLGELPDDRAIMAYIGHGEGYLRIRDDLKAARGWREKLAFLASKLFPDDLQMREKYPESADRPLIMLHGGRLLGGVAKLARRVLP